MTDTDEQVTARERAKAWGIVLVICALIGLYGAVTYFTIGDKGPPPFDYGAANFVPGGSPYSSDTDAIDMDQWKP